MLQELLQQVVSTFQLQATQKGIVLEHCLQPGLPAMIRADELRLRQVLTNLVGNAVKFTEQGSVTLTADYVAPELILSVQDTGIGISPDRLDAIFAPFTQADASMTRRFGGTGLGTTIARQLTELMGGNISVTSTLGSGSCFTVRLPVQLSQQEAVAPVAHQQSVLPPLRILITDDVPENLELLELLLKPRGHHVMKAGSGKEAIALFAQHTFDVILMDVQMPEMDGLQTSRMLHALAAETSRPLPAVIALTASVLSKDREEASQAGMQGFATKPVDLPELEREIARVVQTGLVTFEQQVPVDPMNDDPWQQALQRWGSEAALTTAANAFLRRLRDELSQSEKTHGWLHRIKGAAQNLGLADIARIAADAESSGYFSERETGLMQAALYAAHSKISMSVADVSDLPAKTSDPVAVVAMLKQLQVLLRDSRIDAELMVQLQNELGSAVLKPLSDAMDEFDFELAEKLTKALLQDAEDKI